MNYDVSGVYSELDEIPLYNWFKLIDEGSIKYLFKQKPYKVDVNRVWCGLMDQYLDMMGVSSETIRMWNLKKSIVQNEIKLALTGDNFIKNTITIKKRQLEEFAIDSKPQRQKEMALVAKHQRVGTLNVYSTTAGAYYGIIQTMTDGSTRDPEG